MKDNPLVKNSKALALDIISLSEGIKGKAHLTNQLFRSGTSVGANIREAQYAHGKKDFIAKLEIALKECYETEYWLELFFETGAIDEAVFKKLQQQAGAIRRMLISSCKTAKQNKQQ